MTKKCIGCGIELQTEDIKSEGYVDNIDKDVCERCFKLKNYGQYKGTFWSTNSSYIWN